MLPRACACYRSAHCLRPLAFSATNPAFCLNTTYHHARFSCPRMPPAWLTSRTPQYAAPPHSNSSATRARAARHARFYAGSNAGDGWDMRFGRGTPVRIPPAPTYLATFPRLRLHHAAYRHQHSARPLMPCCGTGHLRAWALPAPRRWREQAGVTAPAYTRSTAACMGLCACLPCAAQNRHLRHYLRAAATRRAHAACHCALRSFLPKVGYFGAIFALVPPRGLPPPTFISSLRCRIVP